MSYNQSGGVMKAPLAVPVHDPVVGDAIPVGSAAAPPPDFAHNIHPDPAHNIHQIIYKPSIFWMLVVFPALLIMSLVLNGIYIHRFITMAKDDYYSFSSSHFISLLVLLIVSVFWILVPGMNIILAGVMAGMVAKDWNKYSRQKATRKPQ